MMKRNDYSRITTIDELRRARFEVDVLASQSKKSVNNSWEGLKKSLSFANLVTSIFTDATLLFTEAEYLRRGYMWLRDLLEHDVVRRTADEKHDRLECGGEESPPEKLT